MCLARVYTSNINTKLKRSPKYTNTFRGYKAYYDHGDGRLSMDKGYVKKKGWNTANNEIIGHRSYSSGFHIFTSIIDAAKYYSKYSVYLVEYKDIVTIGKQDDDDEGITVVAKQMRVIRKLSSKEVIDAGYIDSYEEEHE